MRSPIALTDLRTHISLEDLSPALSNLIASSRCAHTFTQLSGRLRRCVVYIGSMYRDYKVTSEQLDSEISR